MFPELLLVRKICIEDTGIADGGFKVRRSWVWDSLVAQTVKNLPAVWETWVRSLGREEPLEKGMATHSSVLAWRIPGTGEPGGLPSMQSHRVAHD